MKGFYRIYLILTFTICLYTSSFGQIKLNSRYPTAEIIDAVRLQQFHQGLEYQYFYPNIKGHQYFKKALYTTGTISFDGVIYHEVLLNYDILNELVLTPVVREGLTENIILDQARIDWFGLEDLPIFLNIKSDSSSLSPGIYQLLAKQDNVALYRHTKKEVSANLGRPGELLEKFVEVVSYLLDVDGSVHPIKKRKDLEQAFVHRPEVTQYIKDSKIRFKNRQELSRALIDLVNQL